MSEKHTKTISVEGTEITILQIDDTDYICITDMLKAKTVILLSKIGCGTGTRWNFSASGKKSIIPILIGANSP